ncbi:MAG: DUF1957 domain-containing protein [Actinobacteria bacterium]|nr:DUF1957 domain-containing protein [Actinomycetota bacterium]
MAEWEGGGSRGRPVLARALRELLALQSSDWAFLAHTRLAGRASRSGLRPRAAGTGARPRRLVVAGGRRN